MSRQTSFKLRNGVSLIFIAFLVAGCITAESNLRPALVTGGTESIGDGILSVLVAPGRSANCRNHTCRIYYEMPDLGRDAKVIVNNFYVGTFPSGEVVDLGSWSDTGVRISIQDADVRAAYVNMYGSSGY